MTSKESPYFQKLLVRLSGVATPEPLKTVDVLVVDVVGHTNFDIADIRMMWQKANFAKGMFSAQFTRYLQYPQNVNNLANFAGFYSCLSSGKIILQGGRMNSNKNKDANQLRIARKKLRFSQKYIANLLGHKCTATLSKYERGGRPPPLPIAIKLAVVYRSSVEELFPSMHREIKLEVLKAQIKNIR